MNKCLISSAPEWQDFVAGLVYGVGHSDDSIRTTDTVQQLHEVLRVNPEALTDSERERFVQLNPLTIASTELLVKAAEVRPVAYPCVVMSEFYNVGGECFLSAVLQFVYKSDFNE